VVPKRSEAQTQPKMGLLESWEKSLTVHANLMIEPYREG
jgi:hypothetical protein